MFHKFNIYRLSQSYLDYLISYKYMFNSQILQLKIPKSVSIVYYLQKYVYICTCRTRVSEVL
jgi:hypothetical protein